MPVEEGSARSPEVHDDLVLKFSQHCRVPEDTQLVCGLSLPNCVALHDLTEALGATKCEDVFAGLILGNGVGCRCEFEGQISVEEVRVSFELKGSVVEFGVCDHI